MRRAAATTWRVLTRPSPPTARSVSLALSSRRRNASAADNVPAAVRREVYRRDGARCGFVDERGQRCCETHDLERGDSG
jgi:hypothetical protein